MAQQTIVPACQQGPRDRIGPRTVWIAVSIYLAALFILISLTKVQATRSLGYFHRNDSTAFYRTESAVQYRYAKMVAEGKPIPTHDVMLQFPEGVETFRDLTVLMEYVAGYMYRLLGGIVENTSFHVFLIGLTSFFSSLSVIAAYFLARLVFRSHLAGAIASLLYGLSKPSVERLIGLYEREHFAIPFMFGGVALLAASLDPETNRKRHGHALIQAGAAGLLLAVGLASWHFSRFFFLVVAGALALAFLSAPRSRLPDLGRSMGLVMAFVLPAAMLVPALRDKLFWASPPMALLLATVVAVVLETRIGPPAVVNSGTISRSHLKLPLGRLLRLAFVMIPLLAVSVFLGTEGQGYSHVWALLVAKVRHLGVKPLDPSVLPYQARAIWGESCNSPSPYYVLICFWALIPACLLAAWRMLRMHWVHGLPVEQRPPRVPLQLVLILALVFGVLFLAVSRLSVMAFFFLSVTAGGCVYGLRPRMKCLAGACMVPLALILFYEFYHVRKAPTPLRAFIRRAIAYKEPVEICGYHMDQVQVAKWVAESTPEEAVFLANVDEGPLVLTYANRAIVLQPKFEVPGIRDKLREFLEALYSTEEALAVFCETYGVTHYLFDIRSAIDAGPNSYRYMGNATKLSTHTPAYRMQFAPDTLSRFQLVYMNYYYRVYELVDERPHDGVREFPYQPFFDIRRFGGQTGQEAFFDDAYTRDVVKSQNEATAFWARGMAIFHLNRYRDALPYFAEALSRSPSLAGAHTYLGASLAMVSLQGKNPELMRKALEEVTIGADLSPDVPPALYYLGYVRYLAGQYRGALEAWYACRRLEPDFGGLAESIADLERLVAEDPARDR